MSLDGAEGNNDVVPLSVIGLLRSWRLGFVIASLCLGTFLVALDTTIISVAVPSIGTGFQAFEDVGWYGSAYLLTVTAFQPAFGSVYKTFNAKFTYLISVLVFECGSIMCAAAPSSVVFIIGRAIAGIGAAGLYQGALSIVGVTVNLERRPFYLGVVLSVFGIAACLGPPLGGILTENVTWRWCFWINLPIGGVSFFLILTILKLQGSRASPRISIVSRLKTLDMIGMVLIMACVCCIILALHWGSSSLPWDSSRVIGLLTGGGLLLGAFVFSQWKLKDLATVPLRILRQRSIMMGALFSFFLEMSIYVTLYFIPFYFQSAQLVSPTTSGVRGIPLGVSQIAAVVITGLIVSCTGHYVPFMVLGQAVSIIGAVFLTRLQVGTSTVLWATYLVIAGLGHGMGLQMPFTAVQVVLRDDDIPIGNATIVFFSQLGAAVAIAIGQSIFETSLARQVLKSDLPVSPETVITAGPTGLQTLTLANNPTMLRSLQDAYAAALQAVMYFALGTACAAVPFALGMQWLNVKVESRLTVVEREQECWKWKLCRWATAG
ncbi:efflux pump antibiotic resistance protein [Aspergillus cavernicola]|uniref:Efflux pump antibiotic resistance protein n=1 Tax=Aspergillus cavernicola TaxID=176166 RepID=A0ABR4HHU0_9EURO